ncbi:MAG: alpha-ketoacid dehydrogenase subunit beta [Erysipelotrichaceae bacterium]|nr:alpha-ketoacid dehydrogenase subunit beta [Erysipelotrichaceae bacterium]
MSSYKLICEHKMDSRDCRNGYADALAQLLKENEKVVHIDCDLMGCVGVSQLAKEYPDRVINAGIAEANAIGAAAGMAATGLIVFMHTFGVFAGRRISDQVFLSAGYSELPVHIIGTDPGVTAAINGATHMPFEDCASYLTIPNAIVLDPCDYAQAFALTKKCAQSDKLTYMRLIRRGFKTVYADGSDFQIGKGLTLKEGNDVTIICSGIMVNNALKAYEILKEQRINARVIDMFTWRPLDEELIIKAAKETGAIVTAENHQVTCGLGNAVASVIVRNCPVPQEYIGIQNRYGQVGPQDDLEREYELTAEDIVKACIKAINRKKGN